MKNIVLKKKCQRTYDKHKPDDIINYYYRIYRSSSIINL